MFFIKDVFFATHELAKIKVRQEELKKKELAKLIRTTIRKELKSNKTV
jgi:hypothetical protein